MQIIILNHIELDSKILINNQMYQWEVYNLSSLNVNLQMFFFQPEISKPAGPEIEAIPWVVNRGDRLRFNALFKQTDCDRDGFVSGIEIKNVFLQTGLPQNILAHIW